MNVQITFITLGGLKFKTFAWLYVDHELQTTTVAIVLAIINPLDCIAPHGLYFVVIIYTL